MADISKICLPNGEEYNFKDEKARIISEATGNPVVMDGLQGGVPFPEITVSGDIVGQELTISACCKNLLKYPFYHSTMTSGGVTITDNGDGSVTVNGTATGNVVFYCAVRTTGIFSLPNGKYFISGCPKNSNLRIDVSYTTTDGTAATLARDSGNGGGFEMPYYAPLSVGIVIFSGKTYDDVTVRPQLEIGSVATEYEPYHGEKYTITPDSNPYTVPDDIRQQDGLNTVSVSAGELTVIGNKTNPQFKKTVEMLDNKSDLTHKHTKSDITDFPTSLPASDVKAWAKAETKPTYTASEVGADASGSANTALTNAKSYTDTKIADLINGAPSTLDTLGEIAEAMENNQNVVEALDTAIGTKANKSDLTSHTSNKSNPHSVTKSQVGLSNVPNVATNDQTPSYKEASSLNKLTSGEKLSVAFGKISKAITDLISHIADSVKHITSTERTNWNAAKTHADSTHAPSNAQANVIETVKVNGTALTPSSKAVNITVPSYSTATTSADGLMSSSDKKILDILKTPYATCATGRATAAKVATLANFTLTVGSVVVVKFTDTTGTANPTSDTPLTLNVNSTGAKTILYCINGIRSPITGSDGTYFYNNSSHIFLYDGKDWLCMDWNRDNDTKVTNTLATTTKAYVTGTTSATTNTGMQVFDTGVYLDKTAGQLVATTFKGNLDGTAVNATKLESFDSSGNPYIDDDKEKNKVYIQYDGTKYLKLSNDYNKTAADYAASAGITGAVSRPSSGTTATITLDSKPSCVIAFTQSYTNTNTGQMTSSVMVTGNTAQTLYHPTGSIIITLTDTGFTANFNSGSVSMFRYIAFK